MVFYTEIATANFNNQDAKCFIMTQLLNHIAQKSYVMAVMLDFGSEIGLLGLDWT